MVRGRGSPSPNWQACGITSRTWSPSTSSWCQPFETAFSTCSWCWPSIAGGWCTSMSRRPRPRSGRHSRWWRHFPWESPPQYLLRDRDAIYGAAFRKRVASLDFEEVLTAPRSPWQNPYVERLIGSIRRECLDHVIVLNERHLKRVLRGYFDYYHRWRTHLSLGMEAPVPRAVQAADRGEVRAIPEVGGLHHHYERRAA